MAHVFSCQQFGQYASRLITLTKIDCVDNRLITLTSDQRTYLRQQVSILGFHFSLHEKPTVVSFVTNICLRN